MGPDLSCSAGAGEEQGEYLELTENDHAFLADLLQKAEEAGEDVIHPH